MTTYKLCPVCDGTGLTFGEHVDHPCTACGAGGIARPVTSEPAAESFAEQCGDEPVCNGEVKRGENLLRTQSVTVGAIGTHAIVECDNSDDARDVWKFLESLAGAEPTYTMQQASDRIVDGLVLDWKKLTPHWFQAKTEFFQYGVWRRRSGSSIYCGEETEDASSMVATSFDDGKRKILELHKSRFRAEIEKAVANHG